MTKVLIFSDLHIHAHKKNVNRIDDCLDVLNWVYKTALDNKIKHILFLGDLFHDKQKIDVLAYQKTFETFAKYSEEDVHAHLLVGNHDMYFADRWDINSVAPLFIIPNVDVVDKLTTITIGKHEFDLVPYSDNPLEDLASFGSKKRKFLGAHLSVDGARLNSHGAEADVIVEHDGNMVRVDRSVFKNWENVFLGHYHAPQVIDHIEYIGSPLQLNFGEVDQEKHICILDLDTAEKEYIVNDFSPKHLLIPQSKVNEYELANNFVRIMSPDIACAEAVELQREIRKSGNVKTLEMRQVAKKDDEHVVHDATAILLKEDEMIEQYIKDQDEQDESLIKDLDKKLLLEIGKVICAEASVVLQV